MKTGRDSWRFLARSDPKAMNTGPPVLGNLQCPSEMVLHPGLQPLIVSIGPDELDPGEQEVEIGEEKHAADLIVEIGRMNLESLFVVGTCRPVLARISRIPSFI